MYLKPQVVSSFILVLFLSIMFIIVSLSGLGCSGNSASPLEPDHSKIVNSNNRSHFSWGLWQFSVNRDAGTLDITEMRSGDFHLNVIPFLEPPALVNLTIESLAINANIIDADIGLVHPFLALTEFTGFDVAGIVITNGSKADFSDASLRMAVAGDTRLMNPDGLTRWWNPAEFPVNDGTMFAYNDGLLGTPDSTANYNSTLNGYKYYCDGLGVNNPVSDVNPANRGKFSPGSKNIRHYTIELGADGLTFNYAVDASWAFPNGTPPWDVPGDFPPGANKPEAWRVVVDETSNTLWNDGVGGSGGGLSLSIDVYDWYSPELNSVKVESPGNFIAVTVSTPTGGGPGFSTFDIDITGADPALGSIDLLISVKSEISGYGGLLPGIPVTSYFIHPSIVGTTEPGFIWQFSNEITLATHSVRSLESPAIMERPGDIIFAGWGGYMPNQSYGFCSESTDGGANWGGVSQGTNNSAGWDADIKAAYDSTGIAYMGYQCRNSSGVSFAGSIGRFPPDGGTQNSGTGLVIGDNSNEFIFDSTGRVLFFGDTANSIKMMKGSNPDSCFYNGAWHWGFAGAPSTEIVAQPAYCSKTRSIGKETTGDIHFAYFGSGTTNWIKLASSVNDGGIWNNSFIYPGEPGVQFARDPSLDVDAGDHFRVAFVRRAASGSYEIVYTDSADGINWSDPVVAYSSSNDLTETTIDAFQQYSSQHVVITYSEGNAVYLVSSSDGGATWGAPLMVSTPSSSNKQPDMIVDSQNKVHFVWSSLVGGKYDIKNRNAVLVIG